MLRTMACCAGIRLEATSVLLESILARALPRVRSRRREKEKEEEEMARAQSRAFGSTERDFDWQQRHRTTHVDDRRRDVEDRRENSSIFEERGTT